MAERILIVEDEEKIARFIELELKHEGYELNGFEVLRRLRRTSALPVILLTARDAVMDKVAGLDGGADDYITKPFAIEELLARIRLVLKKAAMAAPAAGAAEKKGLAFGELTMDTQRYEVRVAGQQVELTNREFELLKILLENKNIVMTREVLLNRVCGYDYMGETNMIDVYIRYLRSKIDERFGIRMIQTVRGVGYVIREERSEDE